MSILLIISKKQLLVSLMFFSIVFLFSIPFLSALVFIVSFLLVALDLVYSSFSCSLSFKVMLLIWNLSFFLFSFLWPRHVACRILVPWLGIEPRPWKWKCRVLTIGLPGSTLLFFNGNVYNCNVPPYFYFHCIPWVLVWFVFTCH